MVIDMIDTINMTDLTKLQLKSPYEVSYKVVELGIIFARYQIHPKRSSNGEDIVSMKRRNIGFLRKPRPTDNSTSTF